jgi:hypothetical protein
MKQQSRKIVGFDSWTGGAHCYQRLLPALSARSIELNLVHLGSWGNDQGNLREQKMGDLLVRDISYYEGQSFEKMLDYEKPEAVIFLSTDTFAHRALIRYCKQRSIPTLNLYHGLISIGGETEGRSGLPTRSRLGHLRYVLSKIKKLIIRTFPCYINSLLKTNATLIDWKRFICDTYFLAIGSDPAFVQAASDAKTTKCAVYIPADKVHATSCYGFTKQEVFVVGNPDLPHFGLEQYMIGSWFQPKKYDEKSIMYIETGYSSVGAFYSGTQDFISHLLETANSLAVHGYRMRLKLKPNQVNTKDIERGLTNSSIELVSNDNFMQSLKECSACIVEVTSLALFPALLGMPVLLAKYGPLKTLTFGSVLTSYPRAYPLNNITELVPTLDRDEREADLFELKDWIKLNVGPLPPEMMPERVATIIDNMVSDYEIIRNISNLSDSDVIVEK